MSERIIQSIEKDIQSCHEEVNRIVNELCINRELLRKNGISVLLMAIDNSTRNEEMAAENLQRFEAIARSSKNAPEIALFAICSLLSMFALRKERAGPILPQDEKIIDLYQALGHYKFWLGYIESSLLHGGLHELVEEKFSERSRNGALAKLAKDPKQSAKQQVRDCWDIWKSNPDRYKSKSAFARDMLSKYEKLESSEVIQRWCREWESELSKQS